jgi:hypothetical protein
MTMRHPVRHVAMRLAPGWTAQVDFVAQWNLGHILIGGFGIKDRRSSGERIVPRDPWNSTFCPL